MLIREILDQMKKFSLENLNIEEIIPDIYFIHQIKASAYFTRCDGLLFMPRNNQNLNPVIIDLNLEPEYIQKINDVFKLNQYSKLDYICSHGHMDHISHVSKWEELGAIIHFPFPHQNNLISLDAFLEDFGFLKELNKPIVEILGSLNHYVPCKRDPIVFQAGDILTFDKLEIQTIPLEGHSRGMVGLFFPIEKLIHISCLGFDLQKPGGDQFGPWYGFEECSLKLYYENIDTVEKIFLNSSDILTSSHSYVVREKNCEPFDYMRRKIMQNQKNILNAVQDYNEKGLNGDLIDYLLSLDLIYPKNKMKEQLRSTFRFWESWIIKNHLKFKSNS